MEGQSRCVAAGLGTQGSGGLGVKHFSLSQTWVCLPAQSSQVVVRVSAVFILRKPVHPIVPIICFQCFFFWDFIWLCYTLLIAYNMMSWLPTTLNDISRYLCGVLSHILFSKGSLKVTLISWCVWEFLPASAVFIHFPNRKAAQGGNGPILCYYF